MQTSYILFFFEISYAEFISFQNRNIFNIKFT